MIAAGGHDWEPQGNPNMGIKGAAPLSGGVGRGTGNLRGAPRKHEPPGVGVWARALRGPRP